VEGAANEDGRTPTIRDTFVHAGHFLLLLLLINLNHLIKLIIAFLNFGRLLNLKRWSL